MGGLCVSSQMILVASQLAFKGNEAFRFCSQMRKE